jgi:uncharacterized C2H2 Zn-finger protein
MIRENEYICPKCGLVLGSLTEFHRHVEKKHGEKPR